MQLVPLYVTIKPLKLHFGITYSEDIRLEYHFMNPAGPWTAIDTFIQIQVLL